MTTSSPSPNPPPANHPYRFGVNVIAPDADWPSTAREAERLGYDMIGTTDRLGMPAPFPSLVSAAMVTHRIRVATYLTNTSLWEPEVLAREIAGTDRLVGGRLEVGLHQGQSGCGATAALGADERLARLAETLDVLQRLLPDAEHQPQPVQRPRPPLMVGANEPAELELAARRADAVCFVGATLPPEGGLVLLSPDEFAERVDLVRTAASGRTPDLDDDRPLELNVGIKRVVVTEDRKAGAESVRAFAPHLSLDELLDVPTLLIGTHQEMAEQLRGHRERHGLSSFMVLGPDLHAFAPVIPLLREG
jgi:probable F420-dependent oxidoreductase